MYLPVLLALLMHPVHESVAEVEWNRETLRLEIALRIDVLDEQWLRKQFRQGLPADGNWELPYLQRRFRVTDPPPPNQADSAKYKWIGRDEERGYVWWYFEIEPADRMPPEWIENRILFEKEKDHTNRVVMIGRVPKRTLVLTMQRPRAALNQEENDGADESAETDR